jgi:hypothetical protein
MFRRCFRGSRTLIRLVRLMNQYGVMAQEHWARWLPTRYATITDPGSFFSDLGTRVEQRIDGLALQLAGDDPPGETYLDKAGRLGESRHRAEQLVLAEEVLLTPEPGVGEDETSDSRTDRPWGLDFLYSADSQDS